MAVPKRKMSKSKLRSRKRSSAHQRPMVATTTCAQCGAPTQPHRVCAACGTYRGRQVLTVSVEE
jgi:large subunit ribosomal protein L32